MTYYSPDEFEKAIRSTGATFRSYKSILPIVGPNAEGRLPTIAECHYVIPQLLNHAAAEQADYLVYDSMCLWGRMLAQILKISAIKLYMILPLIESFHPFDSYDPAIEMKAHFSPEMLNSLEKICDKYKLQHLNYHDFHFYNEPLNIVCIPREFHPVGEMFDERFKFVGPSFFTRSEITDFPLDQLGSQPLLYISLGTIKNNVPAFYDICLTAFGKQAQQVIIPIGTQVDPKVFGPLPSNINLYPWVPQFDILQRTDIFITHGGMNSVMQALYCGVPMIVVPLSVEQRVTAKRVEDLKLGVVIEDIRFVTAYILRNAVAQIRDNPEFRTSVQSMRNAVLRAGGYQSAIDAIMQLSS